MTSRYGNRWPGGDGHIAWDMMQLRTARMVSRAARQFAQAAPGAAMAGAAYVGGRIADRVTDGAVDQVVDQATSVFKTTMGTGASPPTSETQRVRGNIKTALEASHAAARTGRRTGVHLVDNTPVGTKRKAPSITPARTRRRREPTPGADKAIKVALQSQLSRIPTYPILGPWRKGGAKKFKFRRNLKKGAFGGRWYNRTGTIRYT